MRKRTQSRRQFLIGTSAAGTALFGIGPMPLPGLPSTVFGETSPSFTALEDLKSGWLNPGRSFRPHTRWWWPGSAVTKDGLTWQLEQMQGQGMGGVEIMCAWNMYAKGNLEYLSEEWLEMVGFAIQEAKRLGMEVAVTLGPGWSFGGSWVPPADRSKVLAPAWVDVDGPGVFDSELPLYEINDEKEARLLEELDWTAPDDEALVAAVVGKIDGDGLVASSLKEVTAQVFDNRLQWEIPAGKWRIMAFRLKYTGQMNQAQNYEPKNWVVDHLSRSALSRYCETVGSQFYRAFGHEFGKTVDSFFCDSFEIHPLPNTLGWSNDLVKDFKTYKGYELGRLLPVIWWNVGGLTPRIRYDINEFLHWSGLEITFKTFIDWCDKHNVQARLQPHYRFTEEIIQGAGVTPRPETEVTTARFEVVTDPRKSTAAGAHLYGREIVSAEAYTFIHPVRYWTSLQDMKIATDAFLRDGVTQFYNHGYVYSPEMTVSPARDVPWANRISHWNSWWPYYHNLTAYISRCCFLLRQGNFCGDVMLYSPQAAVWSERVLFGRDRRIMPYGDLGKTLVANGYDFDPVNDDILQNYASVENGEIRVREQSYRFLVLPKIASLPVETLRFMAKFVKSGGVLISLDQLPSQSVGLHDYEVNDREVIDTVTDLFGSDGKGRQHPGGGATYFIPDYKIVEQVFSPGEVPWEATPALTPGKEQFLSALHRHLAPDFSLEGKKQSDGLTFLHRRVGNQEVYFVTNLQPNDVDIPVTFRVKDKVPEAWDPATGSISPVHTFEQKESGIEIPISLSAWGSTILLFRPGTRKVRLAHADLDSIRELSEIKIEGLVSSNRSVSAVVKTSGGEKKVTAQVSSLPGVLELSGNWKLILEGVRFPRVEKQLSSLVSWTEFEDTKYFSGTGVYELSFNLPKEYIQPDIELILDLGLVSNLAAVELNGREVGTAWMIPYRLRATDAARAGRNQLKLRVANLLVNQVAGMKTLPDVPAELVPHYGETTELYDTGRLRAPRDVEFGPLPQSGLLGPVRLIPNRIVSLAL